MTTMAEKAMAMAAKMKTVAAVVDEPEVMATPIPHDPVFLNTTWGAVSIYGHEHIAKKDLVILGVVLNMPEFQADVDHRVRMVIFRTDNRPKDAGIPILANCAPDYGGVCVNLVKNFSAAMEECTNYPQIALRASYHRNLLISLFHEIQHLSVMEDVPTDPDEMDKAEADAITWSWDTLMFLAKTEDIEPAHHSESSFLSGQLVEMLNGKTDDWSKSQQRMLDNGMMYLLPAVEGQHGEMAFHEFKDYAQLISKDPLDENMDNPEWDNVTLKSPGVMQQMLAAIKGVNDMGVGSMPTVTQAVQDAEDMELVDPGIVGTAYDPNMIVFPQQDGTSPNPNTPLFGAGPVAPSYKPQTAVATQVQAEVQTLPRTGFTEQQTYEIAMGVYMKVYSYIFTQCGRQLNSDIGFANLEAVTKVGIPLTDAERAVVIKMDYVEPNGKWCPGVSTEKGTLFGYTSKNGVPLFKVSMNSNGFERQRMIFPQNPGKKNGGNYSKPALAARSGQNILYVKEAHDAVVAAGGQEWLFKIIDGQIVLGS